MKKQGWAAIAVGALGLALVGTARAGAYVSAAICQPTLHQAAVMITSGIWNTYTAYEVDVVCPIPIDHNIGSSVVWETVVYDNNDELPIECVGAVVDSSAYPVASTSYVSSGNSFVGQTTLSYSANVGVGSATYSYITGCTLPPATGGNVSAIRLLRVH